MPRRLTALFALGAAIAALFFAGPAAALTITGGTPEQRAYAAEVIEASALDWQTIDQHYQGVRVLIADHWDGYFMPDPATDYLPGAAGLAYSDGRIIVQSAFDPGPDSFFGEIITHEFAHLDWFALSLAQRRGWGTRIGGVPDGTWMTQPAESYAEHAKVYAWDPSFVSFDYIRSSLPTLSAEEWWAWRNGEAPPPAPRALPFPDVAMSDAELFDAAWWAREMSIFRGYTDGRFGPHDGMTRGHVALVADRWIAGSLPWAAYDYRPATRADVRDALSDLPWNSERWSEPITRSQILRLMWRTQ